MSLLDDETRRGKARALASEVMEVCTDTKTKLHGASSCTRAPAEDCLASSYKECEKCRAISYGFSTRRVTLKWLLIVRLDVRLETFTSKNYWPLSLSLPLAPEAARQFPDVYPSGRPRHEHGTAKRRSVRLHQIGEDPGRAWAISDERG